MAESQILLDPLATTLTVGTNQGGQFTLPYLSQITQNLWQGACGGGRMLLPAGVRHLVNLHVTERFWTVGPLASELHVAMDDVMAEPEGTLVDRLAEHVNQCRADGPTVVSCQVWVNRSSLITARALMLGDGMTADQAITLLREKRSPACLCNPAFEQWLRSLPEPAVLEPAS